MRARARHGPAAAVRFLVLPAVWFGWSPEIFFVARGTGSESDGHSLVSAFCFFDANQGQGGGIIYCSERRTEEALDGVRNVRFGGQKAKGEVSSPFPAVDRPSLTA